MQSCLHLHLSPLMSGLIGLFCFASDAHFTMRVISNICFVTVKLNAHARIITSIILPITLSDVLFTFIITDDNRLSNRPDHSISFSFSSEIHCDARSLSIIDCTRATLLRFDFRLYFGLWFDLD